MNELPFDFKDIVEHSSDAIFITKAFPLEEPGPEIVYANHAYCQQNGYADKEAIGKNSKILQLLESDRNSVMNIRDALNSKQGTQLIYRKENSVGEDRWLELTINPLNNITGEITHFVVIEKDISEQKQLEQLLQELPEKDTLTGLMNRGAFDEALLREFPLFSRTHHAYSLLLIDIDHFKNINVKHGAGSGDMILKQLAGVFEEIFRSYDHIARAGNDQFCVLLRSTSLEHALVSAVRLRQSVQDKAFTVEGDSIHVSVSIGISQVLPIDISYTQAVERAHEALLLAKNKGSGQVQIFQEGMIV